MIIECIKCNKKFEVNSELIPSEGRNIQCGSCNHVWFFNKNDEISLNKIKSSPQEIQINQSNKKDTTSIEVSDRKVRRNKGSEIVKYKKKSNFSFNRFLSLILVGIISFIGLIIILDTFKIFLYSYFPSLENLLFSFFETLKDIELFVRDLI